MSDVQAMLKGLMAAASSSLLSQVQAGFADPTESSGEVVLDDQPLSYHQRRDSGAAQPPAPRRPTPRAVEPARATPPSGGGLLGRVRASKGGSFVLKATKVAASLTPVGAAAVQSASLLQRVRGR